MKTKHHVRSRDDLMREFTALPAVSSGHAVGIIAVDLVYPKLPGNVVNASTFDFPVLYRKVSFDIERLFAGDPAILEEIIAAARELEAQGVRAIFGACGYFAYFQQAVADAVEVPVFLSSLCQLPLISLGLKRGQRVAVFVANGAAFTAELVGAIGVDLAELVIIEVGTLESFAPIRWGRTTLDNGRLTRDLAAMAQKLAVDHPEVGAILLECSDLPPYAAMIQEACGLPVFDFITLIKWVKLAVLQEPYFGFI